MRTVLPITCARNYQKVGKKTVVENCVDNNEVNNNIQNNRGKSKFPYDCGVLSDSSTTKKHLLHH